MWSSHALDKIWARVHLREKFGQDPWTGSSSMAKLGDEDPAQNVKAWLDLG